MGRLTATGGCSEAAEPTAQCDSAWATVFYLAAALYALGGAQYMVFGGMDSAYARQRQSVMRKWSIQDTRDDEQAPLLAREPFEAGDELGPSNRVFVFAACALKRHRVFYRGCERT